MSADVRRVRTADALLIGAGAILLVPWLIVGVFFLRDLTGWPLLAEGFVGGMGSLLFVTGTARFMKRTRVTSSGRTD